jgi:hypothetical protein
VRSEETTPAVQPKHKAPVIHPNAVYSLELARNVLQLAKNCLPREIRLGRLRVSKRAGKYLILGAWLLEWIEAGELPPRQREPEALGISTEISN